MVRNSPCSVYFLTSKPFLPSGIDLFVVCLVSIGSSLLFISFYQFFSRQTRKTNFLFLQISDRFLVSVLFCLIVFYSRGGFLVALTLCSQPISWLFFKHTERGLSKNQLR